MENINSIFGGYYYPGDASDLIVFIGLCPFDIILGWYVIIYCCSYMSHILIGKGKNSLPIQGIGTNPEKIDKEFKPEYNFSLIPKFILNIYKKLTKKK